VKSRLGQLADWIDGRTGWRSLRRHLLEEPLPAGTGWWFTTGSVVMFLLAVQLATGVVLSFYYVPASSSAYDSVRYVMEQVTFGRLLRGLHFFGASFIVIAAVIHMLRVVVSGSYKKPREVTWISGVFLLLVILGFALTGYLLPWDQKAYWATTVTINIARSGPFGELVAGVLRGGPTLGALTLLRWYSAHVFLLPAALFVFTAAHLALMRRHGISGPVRPRALPSTPFYPYHALKDSVVIAVVFALLITIAVTVRAPLDAVADPTNASYVPRPEWYFMSLFQLLKYFPGRLEPVATVVIPGVVVGGLIALPFLDRSPHRDARRRMAVMIAFAVVGVAVSALTYLGIHSTPGTHDQTQWGPLAIAGQEFARDERCQTCHRAGGVANALDETRMRKEPRWTLAHVRDPEVIAPGLRPAPPGGMSEAQAQAILSFMREVSAGGGSPSVSAQERTAALALGRHCATCHMIDGAGGSAAPDLSNVGARHDAAWLRAWISNPESVDALASMPGFSETLTPQQLDAVVAYLASRK
jgi:ubiquinol-cytochrome c reductase cytochrome b subunit